MLYCTLLTCDFFHFFVLSFVSLCRVLICCISISFTKFRLPILLHLCHLVELLVLLYVFVFCLPFCSCCKSAIFTYARYLASFSTATILCNCIMLCLNLLISFCCSQIITLCCSSRVSFSGFVIECHHILLYSRLLVLHLLLLVLQYTTLFVVHYDSVYLYL